MWCCVPASMWRMGRARAAALSTAARRPQPAWSCRTCPRGASPSSTAPTPTSRCLRSRCLATPPSPVKGKPRDLRVVRASRRWRRSRRRSLWPLDGSSRRFVAFTSIWRRLLELETRGFILLGANEIFNLDTLTKRLWAFGFTWTKTRSVKIFMPCDHGRSNNNNETKSKEIETNFRY